MTIQDLLGLELAIRIEGSELVVRFRPAWPAVDFKLYDENNEEITMLITLNADKKRLIKIGNIVDAKGRPARIDGKPDWTATPEGFIALFPSDDGMQCEFDWLQGSAPNVVVLSATIDADLGPTQKNVVRSADVMTQFPEAADFSFEVGPEEDIA